VIEYHSSKRNGQQLLVVDGVRFFRNRKRGHKQYWKCNQYYKNKCPTIIIVDELTSQYQIAHEHSHPIKAKTPDNTPQKSVRNVQICEIVVRNEEIDVGQEQIMIPK
jgi:hypothetical protein